MDNPAPVAAENVVVTQPSASHTNNSTDVKRKVSIVEAPEKSTYAYDNPSYDTTTNYKRKISQTSEHSDGGPVRRKSILHNAHQDNDSVHSNGETRAKKYSTNESIGSRNPYGDLEKSWVYALCMRCHTKETEPSWQPSFWSKMCPAPLCPSYRQFANFLSLILIGALLWVTAYAIIGDTAAPGGSLFNLIVLTIAANIGGWLVSLTTLPRLIGMLFTGILLQNVGLVHFDEEFMEVNKILRKIALVIILTIAGLEMEHDAFKTIYVTIIKLGVIPWLTEFGVITVLSHFLLDFPWMWSILLGVIIAAIAPAVVVPCLFRLRTKGYGVAKGIPTLVIAVSGVDDALSVAGYGIIGSIMFSSGSLAFQIAQAPVCIIGGLGFGVLFALVLKYVPEKGDSYAVPIRTLMLLGFGLISIFGSELLEFEGAGPLAVVFGAFTANFFWIKQGYDFEDNPVTTGFQIFWMIFEPILFGLTGATVKIDELDGKIVGIGCGMLIVSFIIRLFVTAGIAFGDGLNVKEKFFLGLSWMAKATVQAVLGAQTVAHLTSDSTADEKHYAEVVLMVCVLSIVLTAPTGAILISLTGSKLLSKTKQPLNLEGWRRSHRPSLRDISIIDEEEEREDPDDPETHNNTNSNTHIPTVTK